ncbi:hypothetical protein [Bacillus sp. MRMR6]|uniref:hypothetical protein n=1 Tax=Bacillus sp. MRMR6 TaxID=1928617 RepID=UPI0009530265|nr:hypothetical protein [Bacillus sp. MRMR6]OLS36756.1 hypothetical protein BTR25_17220 [Bacillus sp. MRMR6]
MDKQLKDLKRVYEKQNVTTFTNKDRENVYRKLESVQSKPLKDFSKYVPKALTYIAYGLMVVFILGIVNQQLDLFPQDLTRGGKATPNIKEPPITNEDPEFEMYEGKPLNIAVVGESPEIKEKQVSFSGFSFEKIMLMSNDLDSYDAVFIMQENLSQAAESQYADVYLNSTIPFFFISAKSHIPFTVNTTEYNESWDWTPGNSYAVGVLKSAEDDSLKSWGFGLYNDEMIEEHIKEMYSRIFKQVEKESITNDEEEDGIGAPIEDSKSVQTNIEPSAELKALYKGYASKKDDQLLAGLSPLDVFKLYFYAKHLEDSETTYALYIKGEMFGTPSEEEYFGEPEFYGAIFNENDKKLHSELQQVKEFKINYLNDNEAIITWKGQEGSLPAFRLIKDSKMNVWKVSWLPMQ